MTNPVLVQGIEATDAEGTTMPVYRHLRRAILSGELVPGAPVSQVQLAARYGISRSPLREALRLLQNEGLVLAAHNRRMRIAPLTVDGFEELYALRLLTEPLAVSVSVPLLTDAELDAIRVANDQSRTALEQRDLAALHVPHRIFHMGLCAHAGDRVRTMIEDLWDQAERYRHVTLAAPDADVLAMTQIAASEHDRMLAAAEDRDGDLCAAHVAQQLSRVGVALLTTIDPTHEPEALRLAISCNAAVPGAGAVFGRPLSLSRS